MKRAASQMEAPDDEPDAKRIKIEDMPPPCRYGMTCSRKNAQVRA
jgi:hypothetical protein